MWVTRAEILERVRDRDTLKPSAWSTVGELSEKLLRRQFAEDNNGHLRRLRNLCVKAGIRVKNAKAEEESVNSTLSG